VENFAPSALDALGVGFDELTQAHPQLGCVGIKLYPRDAASGGEVGFDLIAQARSGFASLTGFPDDPPTKSGQSASDYFAGALAALAAIAILFDRQRSGRGQHATVSLFESLFLALDGELERVASGGEPRDRAGLHSRQHGDRCRLWRCEDGFVAVDVTKDADLARLRSTLGLAPGADWCGALEGWTAARGHREAALGLAEEGVPAAAVATIAETCGEPQLWWRGMFAPISDPKFGGLVITGSPFRIDDHVAPIRRAAPAPGEANADLLGDTR
jgi:crotonobetainyl-CoA:carnitine CoA-transferase CaiB-like acyl-CoA transferase